MSTDGMLLLMSTDPTDLYFEGRTDMCVCVCKFLDTSQYVVAMMYQITEKPLIQQTS
jgi:hypothetical protein